MNQSIFTLFILALFTFTACQKQDLVKEKDMLFEKEVVKSEKDEDQLCEYGKHEDNYVAGCFDFVYPVSYNMPDGTTLFGANDEAIDIAVKNWYVANSDVFEKPRLNFPVDIKWEADGAIETLQSDADLQRAKDSCSDEQGEE
jgi:hypothetical protein